MGLKFGHTNYARSEGIQFEWNFDCIDVSYFAGNYAKWKMPMN